jgi:hypothetical protein
VGLAAERLALSKVCSSEAPANKIATSSPWEPKEFGAKPVKAVRSKLGALSIGVALSLTSGRPMLSTCTWFCAVSRT